MSKRASFYFPEEAASRLSAIKQRSRFENGAAVIRAALSAYAELLDLARAGGAVHVIDGQGTEWHYSPYTPFNYPAFDELPNAAELAVDGRKPTSFAFSKDAAAKLHAIRQSSYLQSNADVLRAALAAYDELTKVVQLGHRIIIRDGMGRAAPYSPYEPFNPAAFSRESKAVVEQQPVGASTSARPKQKAARALTPA